MGRRHDQQGAGGGRELSQAKKRNRPACQKTGGPVGVSRGSDPVVEDRRRATWRNRKRAHRPARRLFRSIPGRSSRPTGRGGEQTGRNAVHSKDRSRPVRKRGHRPAHMPGHKRARSRPAHSRPDGSRPTGHGDEQTRRNAVRSKDRSRPVRKRGHRPARMPGHKRARSSQTSG